ncbi:hypothetical protein [Rhizobium sp. 2MFCol3.1]|nr:hypothetical protein [Rhizobium sp. 2MFCol3.1]
MTKDNSALIAAIDNAMAAIDRAIQELETRKASVKGIHGRQEEGQKSPQR